MPAEEYLPLLKRIHLFRGLSDEQIMTVARELAVETQPAGKVIFEQGEEGQDFYIIRRGQVKVTRRVGNVTRPVATLVPGDYFGEAALVYGRRRSATITAETEVTLLRLSKEDFENFLRRYPNIKPNLLVSAESHELYRNLKFNWLTPTEVVYLIARRHKFLMWQSIVLPVGLIGVLLIAAGLIGVYVDWELSFFTLLVGGPILAGWLAWQYLDWSNDFYIVTNRRVVYLEKIIGIYDSRQEAPLVSVLSVNVQTAGSLERALGMGDVIVRTFSGPIVMKSVANPQALAALVEEHWNRTRTREQEAEQEAMRQALRRRMRPAPLDAAAPAPAAAAKPGARPALAAPLGGLFSFKLRFEEGGIIIYRKHWYLLVKGLWQPSLAIGVLFTAPVVLVIWGQLPADLSLVVILLIVFVLFIPLAAWWLYQYVDWKNDIYQVTGDQIVDIKRKPFGEETRKAAPLGNILSLKYERPGLLGLLLNYGTVVATVGGTEFRFEGVFDPVGVQNDIYRRMEALNIRRGQSEASKRREEISEWLGVYHSVATEIQKEEEEKTNPPPAT